MIDVTCEATAAIREVCSTPIFLRPSRASSISNQTLPACAHRLRADCAAMRSEPNVPGPSMKLGTLHGSISSPRAVRCTRVGRVGRAAPSIRVRSLSWHRRRRAFLRPVASRGVGSVSGFRSVPRRLCTSRWPRWRPSAAAGERSRALTGVSPHRPCRDLRIPWSPDATSSRLVASESPHRRDGIRECRGASLSSSRPCADRAVPTRCDRGW